MVTPYFSSIKQHIFESFEKASKSIDIAVAWFTNEELYNLLLRKIEEGVSARLVLINDDINNKSGLDFQTFIDKGGELFFGRNGFFMHNKYCIIDGGVVITGSYNYTYFAEHSNFENIVCISEEPQAIRKYIDNYELILKASDIITDISLYIKDHPFTINSHSYERVHNRDRYQKALEEDGDNLQQHTADLEVTAEERELKEFVIQDILYQNWQPNYILQRICATKKEIIFNLKIKIEGAFSIFGLGLDRTWHLETSSGIITPCYINDISINGVPLVQAISDETIYHFYHGSGEVSTHKAKTANGDEAKEIFIEIPSDSKELSCRVAFPTGDYINGIVSLYEGRFSDKNAPNFYHFLNINLLANRTNSETTL